MLCDKLYQFLRRRGPLGGLAATDAGGSLYSESTEPTVDFLSEITKGVTCFPFELVVIRVVSLVQPEKDKTVDNRNVNKVKK